MENGVRCHKCNKKVGAWIGEVSSDGNHYSLHHTNPEKGISLCENCYNAEAKEYLHNYQNISKVEQRGSTITWIPVKKDGKKIIQSYYKCLDCGNQEHVNAINYLPGDAFCGKCDSQGVEIKLGNDLDDEEQHGWHFRILKCSTCHKNRGELLDWPETSFTVGKSKQEIEEVGKKYNRFDNSICQCNRERERERERESNYSNPSPI